MNEAAPKIVCDLCVIGAGSGGLSVAAGAAQMGADVVLVEQGEMGGDCLNTGCVPSKSLLAAAHAAVSARRAARFGVNVPDVSVDGPAVFRHVQGVIQAIAPHDSQERFESLGVTVVRAPARFAGPREVEAGGTLISPKYTVVATGSSPLVPAIPGLAALDPLTTDTIFTLEEIPKHLLVVGGGPVGCELAQAFRGLGADVTLLEMGRILPADDPDLVEVVRTRLLEDGVVLHEEARVLGAEGTPEAPVLLVEGATGHRHTVAGSHILIAAGRRANVLDMGLERAGVDFSPQGIEVDNRLRSVSNRRVLAVGDVAAPGGTAGPRFTHAAGHHAGVVIKNTLFKWPARVRHEVIAHVTYTDPELAHVGLTEAQARDRYGAGVRVLVREFSDNDRARAEGAAEGLLKAVIGRRGRILGCSIAGPHAGELIQSWIFAMEQGLKIGAFANTIAPYPTLGEISKHAAGGYFTPTLYAPRTRALVKVLLKILS